MAVDGRLRTRVRRPRRVAPDTSHGFGPRLTLIADSRAGADVARQEFASEMSRYSADVDDHDMDMGCPNRPSHKQVEQYRRMKAKEYFEELRDRIFAF